MTAMTVEEARELLARALTGTELARRWDTSGLSVEDWSKVKAYLEDILMGQFEVLPYKSYQHSNGVRLFRDSGFNGPAGFGTASDMLLRVVPRE